MANESTNDTESPGAQEALVPVDLSEPQLQAIQAPIDRPLLILAAAGSGKTLVLCHRILHLISKGVDPKEILAVTFTRRAGQDLRSRLRTVASGLEDGKGSKLCSLQGIRVGTFHSFCLSVLRAFPAEAGLDPDFVIFTPKMQVDLLQGLVQDWYAAKSMDKQDSAELRPYNQGTSKCSPEQKALYRVEAQKILVRIRKVQRSKESHPVAQDKFGTDEDGMFKWVYDTYCQVLQEVSGVDFSSFIRHTVQVFQCHPDALQTPEVRAQHVLVDEFQDTDSGQFELLRLLCGHHKCLTIVGDDDQQIYSWRGAAGYHNLRSFEEVFPGATVLKLEQNFRSTGAIVAAARHMIGRNRNRMPKSIRTSSPTGPVLTICECRNEHCEAAAVADQIHTLHRQGIAFHNMAVLYRLHRVGMELRQLLQARFIPCELRGTSLNTAEGRYAINPASSKAADSTGGVFEDVLAVLRLIAKESDEVACSRLVDLFCGQMHPAISACLFHLTSAHRMSSLQAIRCTRSHFLGLLVCKELSSFEPAQLAKKHDSEEQMLAGMHTLLKVVAAAKDDLQSVSLRDVVMNVVQQVGPYREGLGSSQLRTQEYATSRDKPKRFRACSLSEPQESQSQGGRSFEYAGIKALLKEAASFEEMYAHKLASAVNTKHANRRLGSSLKGLRKPSTPVTLASGDASSTGAKQPLYTAVKKLKAFLDTVAIKTYEHELGELDKDDSSTVAISAGDTPATADVVTLSTIHQAKGLEWTSVIIVRANEGVLPIVDADCPPETSRVMEVAQHPGCQSQSAAVDKQQFSSQCGNRIKESFTSGSSPTEDLEEERRLFYVALTRARRFVLVTHVLMDSGQQQLPSRFLADIPAGLTRRVSRFDSSSWTPIQLSQSVDLTPPPVPPRPQSAPPARKLKKPIKEAHVPVKRRKAKRPQGAVGSKFIVD